MSKLTQEELDRVKDRHFNLAVKGIKHSVESANLVTINGMPLKEFLEGVAWLGESSYRLQTLITLAHKYGVELTDETDLFRCDHEFTQAIEQRIMPSGMMWPHFEDGEPVEFGDIIDRNEYCEADANFVVLSLDGSCYGLLSDYDGELHEAGERIKRPEPKQDTLQDVIEDIGDSCKEYWKCVGTYCYCCPAIVDGKRPYEWYEAGGSCTTAMCKDIKRRLEAIAKRMGGDRESKADSPVEIPKQKTCPHCGSSHVITTKVITIGEGRYSEAETDLCLTCGRDLVGDSNE